MSVTTLGESPFLYARRLIGQFTVHRHDLLARAIGQSSDAEIHSMPAHWCVAGTQSGKSVTQFLMAIDSCSLWMCPVCLQ